MSLDLTKLRGAMTALITPFTDSDGVDVVALRRLVEAQIANGISGLVPCGTTGETATLTVEEQERVVKTVLETARGRVPVIAGVGSNSTQATAENARRAERWGADAVLVVCPFYNKPTQEGLFRHYKAVHEATALPVVAYNVPGRTGSDLLPETIGRLVEAGAIVALKDAMGSMQRAVETTIAVGTRPFALISGDDFTILPFIACGGVGVISVVSNLIPADTAKLVRLALAARLDEARPLNARVVELSRALFSTSSPIPVKAGMALAGWCTSKLRLPLEDPSPATVEVMRAAMHRYAGTSPSASLEGFAR